MRMSHLFGVSGSYMQGVVKSLATVIAATSLVASVQGASIFHNGTADSTPAGTDAVDVTFDVGAALSGSAAAFSEVATHLLSYAYDSGTVQVLTEAVTNDTGVAWAEYTIILGGADFFGRGTVAPTIAPAVNPVDVGGVAGDALIDLSPLAGSSITVASSSISRDGENASLNIVFDDPVDPGELFLLWFDIGDVGEAGIPGGLTDAFNLLQIPTAVIPEPAAGLILLVGSMLGVVGRRMR